MLRTFLNLIALIKYGITLGLFLFYLPLTAFETMPGHGMLGGIFRELGYGGIFLTSMTLFAAWWSLMFTQGLVVDGMELRFDREGKPSRKEARQCGDCLRPYIPQWAEDFFDARFNLRQLVIYSLLAFAGLVVISWLSLPALNASSAGMRWWGFITSLVVGICGGAVAYLLMLFGSCLPAVLAEPTFEPLSEPFAKWVFKTLSPQNAPGQHSKAQKVFQAIRGYLTKITPTYMTYILSRKDHKILIEHFFSFINFTGLFVLFFILAYLFHPSSGMFMDWNTPTSAYIFILIMWLIWIFDSLNFHLPRWRISPLAIIVAMAIGYTWFGIDHYFNIQTVNAYHEKEEGKYKPLMPVDVAAAARRTGQENLVVIATSGGGIYASGWTALALKNLSAKRKELQDEIRLISAVSGGAVATSFYIQGMLRYANQDPGAYPSYCQTATKRHVNWDATAVHQKIYENAVCSSLSVTGYGLVFLDFWRFATFGFFGHLLNNDRGTLLEERWGDTGEGQKVGPGQHLTIGRLRQHIRSGRIPAMILNTTVNENGRRIMITPVDFHDPNAPVPDDIRDIENRATTLREYLDLQDLQDISLWSAARLSATFSYVSPSARMRMMGDEKPIDHRLNTDKTLMTPSANRNYMIGHHFIDGGYHDNYGVASALDWLNAAMIAREKGLLAFKRVLLIELRASPEVDPRKQKPASGWTAAVLGPLKGLLAIRDTVAKTRNNIDASNFFIAWRARLKGQQVCMMRLVFQPEEPGPLSWHLSPSQIRTQEEEWTKISSQKMKLIPGLNEKTRMDWMQEFLSGKLQEDPVFQRINCSPPVDS